MKKLKKSLITTFFYFVFFILFAFQNVFASNYLLENTEYSDEYRKWLDLTDEERQGLLTPRMYDISYTKTKYVNPLYNAKMLRASIDSRYNLKDIIPNNLEIRDQKETNTCWAFASLSSLETNLALSNYKKGINLSTVYDFSERHLEYATNKYFLNDVENPTGYNRSVGDGGTYLMAHSYLANGYGAVPEEEMPFENNENIIDISEIQNKTISSQLYDTIEFANYNEETENKIEIMNQIKQHIQNYGSVYVGLHGNSSTTLEYSCYNNFTGAKFCNDENEHPINHAVSIIGWDDNYNVDNFSSDSKPNSNGAWIARNSWGTESRVSSLDTLKEILFNTYKDQEGWSSIDDIPDEYINNFLTSSNLFVKDNDVYQKNGDNGLIYISYEDVNVSKQMSGIVKASDTLNYENIYSYDELGPNRSLTLNQPNLMLSTIFDKKTSGTEYINQVSIYTNDTCTCKVYVNPNGTGRTKNDLQLVSLKSGDSETIYAGYHTLEFSKPIEIKANSFAVVIEIQSSTDKASFCLEGKTSISTTNIYSTAKTETGKCFLALENDLDNCKWYDLSKLSESGLGILIPNGDSTIKAFTTSEYYDESLKNIEIVTPPTKTAYFEGENFDATGMVIRANYNSKINPSVILNSSNYNITNGTNLKVGQTSVTITYEDKSITQPITVEKNSVINLEIKTPPTKTNYKEGESFDKTGMVILATYKDGTTKEITDYTIENGNNLSPDQTELKIVFEEKTVTQPITVKPNPLIKIDVTKAPNKTKYVAGQNFDKTGMVITGTHEDGTTYEIIDYNIENGTNLSINQTYVTITFKGKTTTQAITVEEKAITSISIDKKPTKLTYIQYKEKLDLTGGTLKITYNDESTENIPLDSKDITITGFDNTKLGKQNLIVTYLNKTTQFEIEIVEEAKPINSNLDNIKCDIKKVRVYFYTDNSANDHILIDVEINQIVRNLTNDSVEYYYYLSPNSDEQNINDWVKITEEQNASDKLQFTIDTRNFSNLNELAEENSIYLYIKEVAKKGGNQSIAISNGMKFETTIDKVEIYSDNAKLDNVTGGNTDSNNSNNNDDSTIAPGKLPFTGIKSILIIILIISTLGIIFYIRYKHLKKYIK